MASPKSRIEFAWPVVQLSESENGDPLIGIMWVILVKLIIGVSGIGGLRQLV
jgi:hypothetical protein